MNSNQLPTDTTSLTTEIARLSALVVSLATDRVASMDDADAWRQLHTTSETKFFQLATTVRQIVTSMDVIIPGHRQDAYRNLMQRWRDVLYAAVDHGINVPGQAHDEICICSAIRTEEGHIIRGHRHDDCILTAIKLGLHHKMEGDDGAQWQGFMTSRNRFVDRSEAMRLQQAAGLIRDGGSGLTSEDLY